MYRILVWTERQGWLSREKYPEVHRRFDVSHLQADESANSHDFLLVVDDAILRGHPDTVRKIVQNSRPLLPVITVGTRNENSNQDHEDIVYDVLSETPTEPELLRSVRNASYLLESERRVRESQAAAEERARELEEINAIGIALSAERDHERLLNLILSKSRQITRADAGSLFLVDSLDERLNGDGQALRVQSRWLVFRMAQNDSREFRFEEDYLEITPASIAGYVALMGRTLNIEDAYRLPPEEPFTFNRSFDKATGYRTRSLMVVPMQNRDGDTIGVLQLLNKKRDPAVRLTDEASFEKEVVPFTHFDEQLLRSLASQAAVSVENNTLYQKIETLFDRFVDASVLFIESRDKATKGHSRRVASMTVELARITNVAGRGPYRELKLTEEQIRELKYASLLHDFGKVGVKENVLQKENKLLSGKLGQVQERFNTIRRTIEVDHLRRLLDRLLREGVASEENLILLKTQLEQQLDLEWAEIDRAWAEVQKANLPTVTHLDGFEPIDEIASRDYRHLDGSSRPYLEKRELLALKIPRGTLTEDERDQIKKHVEHTYEFLSEIPWTRDLRNIPEIARGHHLKLDGTGYPANLTGMDIPPQTRMMTISDIFDALHAQDRPYKPRVPVEKALDILKVEASEGQLDEDLLDLFIEGKIFKLAQKG